MTTPTNEEVRRQFEAWADGCGMYVARDVSDGSYISDNTHDAWLGYQAALRSPAVVALVEAVTRYRTAVDGMNDAMRDGANVHGAVSELVGAQDNLDAALATFTTGAGHVE